ncbi:MULTISPECIES: PD40 domain-containing protein [Niastella]|uniref:PD40 domain-containing protein n=1 Tax=Niastella soli TaxID=2821487 RepID=A0ABS3Z4X7_9BACT|nr:PD40 domain-containing protein [Niastella soli]MBO9205204.1 PD40 domain-containing protein [Niastella soli]
MKFNTSLLPIWLLIVFAFHIISCSSNNTSGKNSTTIAYPEPGPDSIAKIFLPGIVSKEGLDFNAAFSPDGKTFYFSRGRNGKYIIYESRYKNNQWQEATISTLFDTLYSNADPFIGVDNALYFISNRPNGKADTTKDYNIYQMVKQGDEYTAPEYLTGVNSDSTEYYVSVARSGNIYFASDRNANLDLYMSKKSAKGYEEPVNLGPVINSVFDEHDPMIAPDESFLVYTSTRPDGFGEADLYITHNVKGRWSNPRNMGYGINTKTYEYCPYLTPDGRYFFYSSEYEVKWISSSVLK